MNERELVDACKLGDPLAQKEIFLQNASNLFGICRRYIKDYHDAQDILMEAFFAIFTKIDSFNFSGSFEGWMKRIVVNQCLMFSP